MMKSTKRINILNAVRTQYIRGLKRTLIRVSGGSGGPPAPPRGRGRGPMTREEAQRLREEEMAAQAQGKDCFIIPQANLDRFLPDGVTVSVQ